MLEIDARAQRLLQLAPVRLEHGGTAVGEEVPELGIHHDGDAAAAREAGRALDHGGGQHALIVVLDQERVGVHHCPLELRGEQLLGAPADRVVHLLVDPHDLLTPRHDPRLGRGGTRRLGDEVAVGEMVRGELAPQRVAARVVADHRHQARLAAHRRHVRRHVGGAAQGVPAAVHGHHGNGGFGRDALRVAHQIDVEHGVAHDDHAAARHLGE